MHGYVERGAGFREGGLIKRERACTHSMIYSDEVVDMHSGASDTRTL